MNYKHYLYLVWTSIALMATAWVSFADTSARYDCSLVQNGINSGLYPTTNTIYNKQTVTLALQHLADFCCKKWYLWSDRPVCNGIENRVWWIESPYIFDHLINLWFRRIDASTTPSLRYSLTADTRWAEWQTKLTSFNDTTKLTSPGEIIDTYNSSTFWQQSFTPYQISASCDLSNDTYNTLSLYERYKVTCELAMCFGKLNPNASANLAQTSAWLIDNQSCDQIAANRKETETNIVRQLLTRVWIRTITSVVDQYTNNYFIWTRRQNLYEQRLTFDQWLTFVNRKIQEGTPVCSN